MTISPFLRAVCAALLLPATFAAAQAPAHKSTARVSAGTVHPDSPWLFAGFKTDSKDGVYYAISTDGFHWKLANGGRPVIHPTEPGELMRDPFIQRAPDGSFRMVWTWAWYDPQMIGYSESSDLVHWAPHRELPVMAAIPGAHNVWAPALYYEPGRHRWLIFWASTIPGRYPAEGTGDTAAAAGSGSKAIELNHRIYYTTTADFHSFAPAKLFFDPGYSVIDATILPPTAAGKPYTMIFKDERKNPLRKYLLTATGPMFEGPWSHISEPISEQWSEGAAIIPVSGGYLAYYDHYSQGQHYGAVFSPDLVHWSNALSRIDFPAGMRHGSFLQITQSEYDRLAALTPDSTPADARDSAQAR